MIPSEVHAAAGRGKALLATDGGVVAATAPLAEEIAAARSYRARAKSENTLRAYEGDWRDVQDWCWTRNLEALPARPEVVATYLASLALAGRANSTVSRRQAAIAWKHRQDGLPAPTSYDGHNLIADTLSGIRREQRGRPRARKAAITALDLARMIRLADGHGTRAVRDRALLSLGLAAALRRSEVVRSSRPMSNL